MEFSSIRFLLYFLPVFFLFYAITPKSFKNITLIAGSFIFYALGEPRNLLVLLGSICVNFLIGRGIDAAKEKEKEGPQRAGSGKWLYVLAVMGNLAVLCHFKLWAEELPLGLSFYTFQVISYLTDLYEGETKGEKSLLRFVTYLAMFPKLISGPITPYETVRERLADRRVDAEMIREGLERFVLGLALKTLLADRIGILWVEVGKTGYESITWRYAWLGTLAYSMMLYFNFYGYSLMAIGLGKLVGFDLPENFKLPYLSGSVREFYRRWHVTMGLWFRKYVYIPLGGSRKGEGRTILNLLVVWLLTGFWHGVTLNYFLWGVFLWLCIFVERLWEKLPFAKKLKVLPHLWLLFVIPISWMFFAITDVREVQIYLTRLFGVGNPVNGNPSDYLMALRRHGVALLCGVICCTGVVEKVLEKWGKRFTKNLFLTAVFWLCVWKIMTAGSNPFLYLNY